MSFESRVELMCRRYGFDIPELEPLEFGYSRIRLDAVSKNQLDAMEHLIRRINNARIVRRWENGDGGFYEGAIWIMERSRYEQYSQKMEEKQAYLEDWWQRYHVADEETRRLMACGNIA